MLTTFLKEKGRGTGIVFVNRKNEIEEIEKKLQENGVTKKIFTLHGGMDIKERRKTFREFKNKHGVLICSDIAARGIDIHEVGWVLNYDLPFQAVYYIHRCGRTSRGEGKGLVFNFVTPRDRGVIAKINDAIVNQTALRLKTLKPPRGSAPTEAGSNTKKKTGTSGALRKTKKTPLRKTKKTPRYKHKRK